MAKFLLTVWPIAGHYIPNLSIAHALRERGHEVSFYTGTRIKAIVEGEGFRFFPFLRVNEKLVDQVFYSNPISSSGWKKWLEQRDKYRKFLVGMLQEQVMDLDDVLAEWKSDVVVCDPAMWAPCLCLHETHRVPVAIFAYIPVCLLPGANVSPPGMGLPPPRNWWRHIQARVAGAAIRLLTTDIRREANAVRKQNGLQPLRITVMELQGLMPLYLVAGSPEFDYNRCDLPDSVHYIGPCFPNRSTDEAPPAWLDALPRDRPWVHVTEGTVHVQKPFVLQAAAKGLADLPVQVIMATGTHRKPAEIGLEPIAPNIRVERWVPYDHMLPHTGVVVTTGGSGTVMSALMAGVPLVVIPTEWDKPANAQRVVDAGAGLRLSPRRCTPGRLRSAVEAVLRDPTFRRNAQRMAKTFRQCGGPPAAAKLLEGLAISSANNPKSYLLQGIEATKYSGGRYL